jgi:phospholipase C
VHVARAENAWVRFRSAAGSAMMSFGQWLSKDFYQAKDEREARTSHAFTRLSQAMHGAARAPQKDALPPTQHP